MNKTLSVTSVKF